MKKSTYKPKDNTLRNPSRAWCGFCKKITRRDKNYKCIRCQ